MGSLGICRGRWLELEALSPGEDSLISMRGDPPPSAGRAAPRPPPHGGVLIFGRMPTSRLT